MDDAVVRVELEQLEQLEQLVRAVESKPRVCSRCRAGPYAALSVTDEDSRAAMADASTTGDVDGQKESK